MGNQRMSPFDFNSGQLVGSRRNKVARNYIIGPSFIVECDWDIETKMHEILKRKRDWDV